MIELWYAAIFLAVLALLLIYRLIKGPHIIDRIIATEAIDILLIGVLVIFTVLSGRGIYLDIALVLALLGFIGEVFVAKYVEGSL